MATDILDTLAKVRKDPKLAKEFSGDPEGTLKKMGVDTKGLHISKVTPAVRGTQQASAAATVCGSVGCVVCGSVG